MHLSLGVNVTLYGTINILSLESKEKGLRKVHSNSLAVLGVLVYLRRSQ
jgi:hypothetical protein